MLLGSYAPEPAFVGQTIAQIAAQRQEEPAVTFLWLINRAEDYRKAHPDVKDVESVIGTAMAASDVADFMAWPHANICSDGMLKGRHPRGAGAFAKVLRATVREQHRLSLEAAVRKMSALSAQHVGLQGRGLIKPGYAADLVLFDPARITDHASIQTPRAIATGVSSVWVNGALVYDHGRPTEVYAGRFLKRGGVR
jgi:N-acyl-D-amino-acid deacylase